MILTEATKEDSHARLLSSTAALLPPIALFRLHSIASTDPLPPTVIRAPHYGIFDGLDPQRSYLSAAIPPSPSKVAICAPSAGEDADEF